MFFQFASSTSTEPKKHLAETLFRNGLHEEELLFERFTQVLEAHDPKVPLFFFYAFHIVHAPLEVPQVWLDKFSFITDSKTRQKYHAMVNYMDTVVGNITTMVKAKGMWDDMLIGDRSATGPGELAKIYRAGGVSPTVCLGTQEPHPPQFVHEMEGAPIETLPCSAVRPELLHRWVRWKLSHRNSSQ